MYSPSPNNSKAARLADTPSQTVASNDVPSDSSSAQNSGHGYQANQWPSTPNQVTHAHSHSSHGQTNHEQSDEAAYEPTIVPVKSRKTISDIGPHNGIRPPSAVSTEWETPYNRPAYESGESIHYSRLASQYLQQGRIEDAERLYALALELAERTLPADSPVIEHAIEDMAGFYIGREKWDRAEPLVARLLDQRSQTLPADDSLLIRTVDMLAGIYEKNGQFVQATALYKFLVLRQEEGCGRSSIIVAFTLSRMAECYLRQEQYPSAEVLMTRILGIQEANYGRSSIEISTTLQELSNVFQKQGKFDRAAEMLERLVHILEDLHGPHGLAVASCLLRLADLLTEVNMFDQAEPLYRRAQDIYQRSYGNQTAAHSMFKAKLNRFSKTTTDLSAMSKRSCDLPTEQLRSASMPAFRPTAEPLSDSVAAGDSSLVSDSSTESGRHRTYPHIIDFEKPSVESTLKLTRNTIEKDTQEMTLVLADDAPVAPCDALVLPAEQQVEQQASVEQQVPEQQVPVEQQVLPLTPPEEPPLTPPLLVPEWPSNLSAEPASIVTPTVAASASPTPAAPVEADAVAEVTKPKTIWSVIDTVAFSRTVAQKEQ